MLSAQVDRLRGPYSNGSTSLGIRFLSQEFGPGSAISNPDCRSYSHDARQPTPRQGNWYIQQVRLHFTLLLSAAMSALTSPPSDYPIESRVRTAPGTRCSAVGSLAPSKLSFQTSDGLVSDDPPDLSFLPGDRKNPACQITINEDQDIAVTGMCQPYIDADLQAKHNILYVIPIN